MCSPLQEYVPQFALIVCIVRVFTHKCHNLAAFNDCFIDFSVDSFGSLEKLLLLLFVIIRIITLDDAHVTHLVIHACNGFFCVSDISDRLPVHHHSHQVLAIVLEPVINCSPHDTLSVLIGTRPLLPRLKPFRYALEVGSREGVRHASLAHFLQVCAHHRVSLAFVCVPLGQTAKLVVLHRHFLSELILMLDLHLHLHVVTSFHPEAKCSLLHPVVHLTEENLPVALSCHLLLVEGLDGIKALAERAMI